jgi:predicted RNA methylase
MNNYNLKGFQLKNIIEQYNTENPNKQIKSYKYKTIKELNELIKNNKIDISKYKIINDNPYKQNVNLFKKAGVKPYSNELQNEFIVSLNQNDRYKNPLQSLNKYTNKEGKMEYLEPLAHQKKFILQFIYSNLKGAILFHGVGTGKTLTAVISSYYYLKMYPTNRVVVISPSSLLFNFIAGLVQYGLDKNDNRYSFYTYEKYTRNPKIAKDSLLIVDEAHNFRTEIKSHSINDPESKKQIDTIPSQNKRGFNLMKYGSDYCHKIILLTGTPFVNKLYDIENLLAMIDQRKPISEPNYKNVLDNVDTIRDYFNFRISHYESNNNDGFFPVRREIIKTIYMTEKQEKEYKKIKNKPFTNKDGEKTSVNPFYISEKFASNTIDKLHNPKIDYIVQLIKDNPKQKFIVYSGLYENGIINIEKKLNEANIKVLKITGRQTPLQKEQNKLYFNFYNFNDINFFNIKNFDISLHKFINNEFRVLLISKAGSEGVDTINCQNILLFDSQWNDTTSEQIIARAIRFKSHIGLPQKERYVNVIRVMFCFKSDKSIIDKINNGTINYINLYKQIKDSVSEELKHHKVLDNRYVPTLKELKSLTYLNSKEKFIPEITSYGKSIGAWGRKSTTYQSSNDGWDIYNKLTTEEQKKKWKIKMYYKWYSLNNSDNSTHFQSHSIDLWLFIICKAKQTTINDFIYYFGNVIKLFESYEPKILKLMREKELKLKRELTEEEKIQIYKQNKNEEIKLLLKSENIVKDIKNDRNNQNILQQFFTNEILAKFLYEFSSLKINKSTQIIKILEPTAGHGALIRPILENNKNVDISLIEIDSNNRKVLEKLSKDYPTIINLQNQPNFLIYESSDRFDYIYMNPPFHLRKSEDFNLIRDVWDIDFVKKAFAFLKIDGELLAIISNKWFQNENFKEWINKKNKTFAYEFKDNMKFNQIKINITCIKIIKLDDSEDNEIFGEKFYIKQGIKGNLLNENEISPSKIMNDKN